MRRNVPLRQAFNCYTCEIDIGTDPSSALVAGHGIGRARSSKRVKDDVAYVRRHLNYTIKDFGGKRVCWALF
jgi:hypothetical protein